MAQLYPVYVTSNPEIFGIIAHEILHTLVAEDYAGGYAKGYLSDVLESDNIMHSGIAKGAKIGILRFREQTCVYTGTVDTTVEKENQWNVIYRE